MPSRSFSPRSSPQRELPLGRSRRQQFCAQMAGGVSKPMRTINTLLDHIRITTVKLTNGIGISRMSPSVMKSEMECEYPTANVSTHFAAKFSGLVKSVCTSFLHMKTNAKIHDKDQALINAIMMRKKMLRASLYEGMIVKIRR